MLYTIGEMADRLGVAPSTLRYYDKEGLLPHLERSGGGQRLFGEADLARLAIIDCLKRSGLPIKDIRQFIDWSLAGDATISQRLELFHRRREAVRQQMAQLEDTLRMLDYKCWYYETAQAAGACADPDQIPLEQVPAPLRDIHRSFQTQPQ